MGHYCRICRRLRPNEKFSGKGHRDHVCRDCVAMPKAERDAIEHEEEIFGFMAQSNISASNIARLRTLSRSDNLRIADLAAVVLEVARVKPHKKRRLQYLAQRHRPLLAKLRETGLVFPHGG